MAAGSLLSLEALSRSKSAMIKAVRTDGLLKQKLFNMGFIPGVEVEMIRSAPLLDPLEVKILDYLVTLRREEARITEVEEI